MQTSEARAERVRFTDRDEGDLRWFFGEGQSEFERSPHGFMEERLRVLSETSDGERVLSMPMYRARVWRYRQAGCRGWRVGIMTGAPIGRSTELFDAATRDLLRRAAAPFVELYDPEADAWFGHGQYGSEPGMPSDWAMQRLGRVSRRLRAMPGRLYSALATYHGLAANRYEGHILGRIVVLYALTEAGGRILDQRARRLPSDEDAGLRPEERVSAEYQIQLGTPELERRRLFSSAASQASGLRARAHAAYAAGAR